MTWFLLLLATLLYSVCAYISYHDGLRQKWYFVPTGVILGAIVSTIWLIAIRILDDKYKIYVYSLFWDFVMLSVYYFLPAVAFGIKLDKWSLFGLFLIACGIAIVKTRL